LCFAGTWDPLLDRRRHHQGPVERAFETIASRLHFHGQNRQNNIKFISAGGTMLQVQQAGRNWALVTAL